MKIQFFGGFLSVLFLNILFLSAFQECLFAEDEPSCEEIRQFWIDAMGTPKNYVFDAKTERVETFETEDFRGELLFQQNGPNTRQKALLLKPLDLKEGEKRAGFVVPYYEPDRMCGYDFETKKRQKPGREYAEFGRLLVREGYVVLCVEAYPFNLLTEEAEAGRSQGLKFWQRAAEELKRIEPEWTGMGKLTADVRLAVDYLAELECVDRERLGIAGHSLGGKMAFYGGTLDERLSIVWSSDFGMRWEDSNWDDPWYWGKEKVELFQKKGVDHGSLLELLAPGTFILIAGEADGEQTRPLLEQTREKLQKSGKELEIFFLNHASGHQPTRETVEKALKLIRERFSRKKIDFPPLSI